MKLYRDRSRGITPHTKAASVERRSALLRLSACAGEFVANHFRVVIDVILSRRDCSHERGPAESSYPEILRTDIVVTFLLGVNSERNPADASKAERRCDVRELVSIRAVDFHFGSQIDRLLQRRTGTLLATYKGSASRIVCSPCQSNGMKSSGPDTSA